MLLAFEWWTNCHRLCGQIPPPATWLVERRWTALFTQICAHLPPDIGFRFEDVLSKHFKADKEKSKHFYKKYVLFTCEYKTSYKVKLCHFIQSQKKGNNIVFPFTSRSDQPACPGRPGPSAPSSSCRRWDSPDWDAHTHTHGDTVEGSQLQNNKTWRKQSSLFTLHCSHCYMSRGQKQQLLAVLAR